MTIAEIKKQLTDSFMQNETIISLYGLQSAVFEEEFSEVSFENIIFSIIAFFHWGLYTLFDLHKAECQQLIAEQKSYRGAWFVMMTKQFQYGFTLVPDKDYYDNTGIDEATVEASKVVSFAAAEELQNGVRIKVAKLVSGDLQPLPSPEFEALKMYWSRVKPWGVNVKDYFVNVSSDSLKLTIHVAVDRLILDATGKRIDGTSDTPVKDAIINYLQNGMDFNGLFKPMRLVDYVQAVDGVDNVDIEIVEARYGANPYAAVGLKYQPYSGYLRFLNPSDLTIIYEPA